MVNNHSTSTQELSLFSVRSNRMNSGGIIGLIYTTASLMGQVCFLRTWQIIITLVINDSKIFTKSIWVLVILLSIFALTPAPIRTYSRAYPHLLLLTPAHSRSLTLTHTHSHFFFPVILLAWLEMKNTCAITSYFGFCHYSVYMHLCSSCGYMWGSVPSLMLHAQFEELKLHVLLNQLINLCRTWLLLMIEIC